METIPKAECRKIGFIRKLHGIKGEVILEFEAEPEYTVTDINRFLIELDGLLVPFFVSDNGIELKYSNSALVKFDWVDSKKYARRLVGKGVYLFLDEAEALPVKDSFSGLIGYKVFDQGNNLIGVVTKVEDFSGNIVFEMISGNNKFLIPFNNELLISFNNKKQTMNLQLPEGLL